MAALADDTRSLFRAHWVCCNGSVILIYVSVTLSNVSKICVTETLIVSVTQIFDFFVCNMQVRSYCASAICQREDEEEKRSLIIDLKRHARLAVAWSRHGSLVPRST